MLGNMCYHQLFYLVQGSPYESHQEFWDIPDCSSNSITFFTDFALEGYYSKDSIGLFKQEPSPQVWNYLSVGTGLELVAFYVFPEDMNFHVF